MEGIDSVPPSDSENPWSPHTETTASISGSASQDISQTLADLFEKQSSYFAQCIKDDIDPYTKKPL